MTHGGLVRQPRDSSSSPAGGTAVEDGCGRADCRHRRPAPLPARWPAADAVGGSGRVRGAGQAAQYPVDEASDLNQKKKSVPSSTFVARVVHCPAVVSV